MKYTTVYADGTTKTIIPEAGITVKKFSEIKTKYLN